MNSTFAKKICNNTLLATTLLLSLLLTMMLPINQALAENNSTPSTTTILILGDSISAAYGVKLQQGWVDLLQQQLNADSPNQYQVINASISGETTIGGLTRLPELLKNHQPDIVIIELGANDGLRGYTIKSIRENLAQIVELSQLANAQVIIAGMHIPPNYGSRYTQQFYASFSVTAQKYNIGLIPFLLEGVAVYPELMQDDGLHPTGEAQPKILQNVIPHLKAIL